MSARFVRWQTVLREHLSYVNNLLLISSFAIIGFVLNLLNDSHFQPSCCTKTHLFFGILLVLASSLFGLIMAFSRLMDFRTTVRKIKLEEQGATPSSLGSLKASMDMYSAMTWLFFYCQILSLFLSLINFFYFFILHYSVKLF